MAHYDETRATQLRADASPVGVGAILMQHDGTTLRAVGFASRTLTILERLYLQTECEALAVVWVVNDFTFTYTARNSASTLIISL